jgi:chemotaxis protein CheZ
MAGDPAFSGTAQDQGVQNMSTEATRAERIAQVMDEVGIGNNGEITINEILSLAQTMTKSLDGVYRAVDASVQREFREIGSYIEVMKTDIAGLQANDLQETHLPTTGQRISKVVETLTMIDERVSRFAKRMQVEDAEGHATEGEADRAKRKKDLLLDGPQAKGEAINQDEVDNLFSAA